PPDGNAAPVSGGAASVASATLPVDRDSVERPLQEQLQRAVFTSRLRRLHRLLRQKPALGEGCFLFGAMFITWVIAYASIHGLSYLGAGPQGAVVGMPLGAILGLLAASLVMLGLSRLVKKGRERTIREKIDVILEQFPREARRWGDRSL